ncbi:ankyrin repeat domain-containing protein [Candidatus Berkiella aquae]|uniref:Ankyrin repeat domain-containing protein n=1 Tax=Candidatus Berkiella aquae TaxID=295108 RepID=A0A0Q9YJQ7_9GAMM|nr:ankyrin repeat domain-containing protein [Candidatus Berkiella aquae]MCS5711378.1 ankyrin repeat domain-containing protein [Candidatus Berkiella aquae]
MILGANLIENTTKFFELIQKPYTEENAELLTSLIQNGIDIHARDKRGMTPLHIAAACGYSSIIQQLLERGAAFNVETNVGDTPLHLATLANHPAVVSLLLEKGAHADLKNADGLTPIFLAARMGLTDIIAQLLTRKADFNFVKDLLAGKAPLTKIHPLGYATKHNYGEIIPYLLKQGEDLNTLDSTGYAPLHLAAYYNLPQMTKILLSYGANIEIQDNQGKRTPLHLAAVRDNVEIIQLLVEQNADTESQDIDNHTPLHLAVINARYKAVEVLLQRGANVHATRYEDEAEYGTNALHMAAQQRNTKLLQLLLKYGADLNEIYDVNDFTALTQTALNGDYKNFKMLLEYGAELNIELSAVINPIILREILYIILNKINQTQRLDFVNEALALAPGTTIEDIATAVMERTDQAYTDAAVVIENQYANAMKLQTLTSTPLLFGRLLADIKGNPYLMPIRHIERAEEPYAQALPSIEASDDIESDQELKSSAALFKHN